MTVRVTALKGAAAGQYYVAEVGSYYLAAEEPRGRWFGDGAVRLGLNGVSFDDAAFVSVLAGIDPSSGVELGRAFNDRSVSGFDVTFSAPKSVSLLAAVADPVVCREVVGAHDAAVDAVLGYVQRHALTRFRVDGEVMSVDAEGILAGVFRQHVSRELDPQLHSHAVIANRVPSPDGRWLALDARPLVKDQTVLSALYHAGLRAELTSRLGVAWQQVDNGIAEMAGIDQRILDVFSQRAGQVESRLEVKLGRFRDALGREPTGRERWRLQREAVADSRRSKPAAADPVELRSRWNAQLAELGIDAQRLTGAVIGRTLEPGRQLAVEPLLARQAVAALEAGRSTWRQPEIVRELARATPTETGVVAASLVRGLEEAASELGRERLVELARPVAEGVAVRASDGRPAWESPLERRYTTQRILDQEEALAGWANRRWSERGDAGVVDEERLDLGQAAAARAVAGDAGLVVVVGPAGAGKTTALRPAIEALIDEGREVFAVAPTATAAAVLAAETGVSADTIDKLLLEHRRRNGPSPTHRLGPGGTLIVDEAAMVATPALAELARLADRRDWRVVLVGDAAQYLPVGRGGMFDWLVEHGPTIELDRIHRFTEPWERTASLALRSGDTDALTLYEAHGRLHRGLPGEIDFDVIDHWSALRADGHSVAILAASNDTVHRLNQLAQNQRIGAGELDAHGPSVVTSVGVRLLVGDEIATRQNDRRLRTDHGEMVRNRDHWHIKTITPDGEIIATGRSGSIQLPASYVEEHVELAYAQTGHGAQGRTVDHSLLLVDGNIDNRGVYVPLTRGAHSNHAYVALTADDQRSPRDVLAEAVNRDWADIPAITYRKQLELAVASGQQAVAVPRPPLTPTQLRRVAGELRRIDDLAVPFWRNQHQRELDHTNHQRGEHQRTAAQLDVAKGERDRIGERLAELSPWNPFQARERRRLAIDNRYANHAVARHRQSVGRSAEQLDKAEAKLAEREAWLERHEPDYQRRPELHVELERDKQARIEQAADRPAPRWALNTLGQRPNNPDLADIWDHAVGTTEQYRTIHNITSDTTAIGGRPHRSDIDYYPWATTAATLGHAAHQLGHTNHLDPHLRHHLEVDHQAGLGISM